MDITIINTTPGIPSYVPIGDVSRALQKFTYIYIYIYNAKYICMYMHSEVLVLLLIKTNTFYG